MVVTCMEQAGGWRRLVGARTHLEGVLLLARCGAGCGRSRGMGVGGGFWRESSVWPRPSALVAHATTTCEACSRTSVAAAAQHKDNAQRLDGHGLLLPG